MWWKAWLVVGGVLAASGVANENVAHACYNEVERETDPKTDALVTAESALARGELATAARRVSKFFPALRQQESVSGTLELRAARILALVSVRSGGGWLDGNGNLVTPDEQEVRGANLKWAIKQLRLRAAANPGSPPAKADLGEALAASPSDRPEARKLLESLAKKRLLSSGYGYAALAKLRRADGDEKGAEAALSECKKRANVPGVCDINHGKAQG
jgi:hypothetical protein